MYTTHQPGLVCVMLILAATIFTVIGSRIYDDGIRSESIGKLLLGWLVGVWIPIAIIVQWCIVWEAWIGKG